MSSSPFRLLLSFTIVYLVYRACILACHAREIHLVAYLENLPFVSSLNWKRTKNWLAPIHPPLVAHTGPFSRLHKPCYFIWFLLACATICYFILNHLLLSYVMDKFVICLSLSWISISMPMLVYLCLDIHALTCLCHACFLKNIRKASHISKRCTLHSKGKFNQVHTLWGSLLNIFYGNIFISSP